MHDYISRKHYVNPWFQNSYIIIIKFRFIIYYIGLRYLELFKILEGKLALLYHMTAIYIILEKSNRT